MGELDVVDKGKGDCEKSQKEVTDTKKRGSERWGKRMGMKENGEGQSEGRGWKKEDLLRLQGRAAR